MTATQYVRVFAQASNMMLIKVLYVLQEDTDAPSTPLDLERTSTGILSRGSPMQLRTMRKCAGSSATSGRTFLATGLYFFLLLRNTCTGLTVDGAVEMGGWSSEVDS